MQEWAQNFFQSPYASVVTFTTLGFLIGFLIGSRYIRRFSVSKIEEEGQGRINQFVNLVSHYLITPLSIIQASLTKLQDNDATLTAEQRQSIYASIDAGQKRLWIVTQQILLADEIDNHQLRPRLEASNLAEVISTVISDIDLFARPKGVTIKFQSELESTAEVKIDARKMRQAFIALLDNAVKFSEAQTVVVVRLTKDESGFIVEITDQGIGMTKEVTTHLGERFYRGSNLYTFDYEGVGLGLYIAFAIIREHQGELHFMTEAKKGTVAMVRLPIV